MISKFINKIIMADKNINTRNKIRISILSILSGIFISSIFIAILGHNPIYVFIDIFQGSFKSKAQIINLLILSGSFIISALAISLSFKAGLFNIGVSGQMILAGSITMLLALKFQVPWYLLVFISILIGAIAAGIPGVLKSLFNVNEVVSTLLLNWVWFFIFRYLTNTSNSYMDATGNSIALSGSSLISSQNLRTILTLFLGLFTSISIWFLFSKTSFGFKLKMVGSNKNAAKYSGVDVRKMIIISMLLSGALSGLLGFVVYFIKDQQIKFPKTLSLPTIGFDGIAISLLSFNSPIGIILVSFLWGMLNIGGQFASSIDPTIKAQVVQMVIGIIIYFAAISSLFYKLKPINLSRNFYLNIKDKNIWNVRRKFLKAIKEQWKLFNEKIQNTKMERKKLDFQELKFEKQNLHKTIKKLKSKYRDNIKNIDKNKKLDLYLNLINDIKNSKHKFYVFKEENNFNLLKNIKKERVISIKILIRSHKSKISRIISNRNNKNKIGIYAHYRNKILDIISNYEIELSNLKLNSKAIKQDIRKNQQEKLKNDFTKKMKLEKQIYKNNINKLRNGGN